MYILTVGIEITCWIGNRFYFRRKLIPPVYDSFHSIYFRRLICVYTMMCYNEYI